SENPRFLAELISRYFLTNTHFVRLCMNPSQELAAHEQDAEIERLRQIQKTLNEKEIHAIIERSKALSKQQTEESDAKIALLPKISLADVPKKSRTLALTHIQAGTAGGSLDLFCHTAFTNNITYA